MIFHGYPQGLRQLTNPLLLRAHHGLQNQAVFHLEIEIGSTSAKWTGLMLDVMSCPSKLIALLTYELVRAYPVSAAAALGLQANVLGCRVPLVAHMAKLRDDLIITSDIVGHDGEVSLTQVIPRQSQTTISYPLTT